MNRSKLKNRFLSFILISIAGINSYSLAAETNTLVNADGTLNSLGMLRYTDWSVKWKSYPTVLPGWTASVTYVGASGPGAGLVAPCGESGLVIYVRGHKQNNSLRVSKTNLRTGDTKEYELPKLNLTIGHSVNHREQFDYTDLKWISCSADGSRVALSYETNLGKDFRVHKNFIVDLSTLKVIPLEELMISRQVEITGRPINTSFSLMLGSKSDENAANAIGLNILPIENIVDDVRKLLDADSVAKVLLNDESAFIIVSGKQENSQPEKQQKITFIQIKGKQFSDVKKCSINGYRLRYSQPASSGLVITVSQLNDLHKSRPYYLIQGNHDDGLCDLMPLGEWSLRQEPESPGYADDTPGYAGDFSSLASAYFKLPKKIVDTFGVNFYLSVDQASPIFSSQIAFRGIGTIDEQPLIWMPLSVPSKDQFIFVYGPHGAGTAFVHFWKLNKN